MTIRLALESHLGERIPSDHNIAPWMVEYAAVLLNRFQVGADGKMSYERLKRKPPNLLGMQFEEKITWESNVLAKDRKHRMGPAWKSGIYIGQRSVPGEYLVGSKEGVFRPRTIHRVPLESIWKDNFSLVIELPWNRNDKHEIGEEVILDIPALEPSLRPAGAPLPQ